MSLLIMKWRCRDHSPLLTVGCNEALRLEASHMVAVSTNTVSLTSLST